MDLEELLRCIGQRIAELRVAANRTQESLAAELGVTPRYVQRVESGRDNLSIATMFGVAQVLGVQVADFFVKPAKLRPPRVRRRARPAKRPNPPRTSSSRKG